MKRKSFLASMLILPVLKLIGRPNDIAVAACKTQRDEEGPYYKGGAPFKPLIETNGEALTITGRVLKSSDCSTPVANAVIDIWHCDKSGNYDNEGFKCRGLVKCDSKGRYSFKTIFPPSYGSRPRHIHFKVRADGFNELTSQIYFKGDPHIENDFAQNAESTRILSLAKMNDELQGQFDIYI